MITLEGKKITKSNLEEAAKRCKKIFSGYPIIMFKCVGEGNKVRRAQFLSAKKYAFCQQPFSHENDHYIPYNELISISFLDRTEELYNRICALEFCVGKLAGEIKKVI